MSPEMHDITFVCISLTKDTGRRQHIEDMLKSIGIQQVVWWLVTPHPVGGIYGCFESHWYVWDHNWSTPYICVFEDDALIGTNYTTATCQQHLTTLISLLPTLLNQHENRDQKYNPANSHHDICDDNNLDVIHLSCEQLAVAPDKRLFINPDTHSCSPTPPFYHPSRHDISTCSSTGDITNKVDVKPCRMVYGKFISSLAYIVEPVVLKNKMSRLLPLYGSNIDIAMAIHFNEAAIYPPLFYQTYEDSNISFTRRGLGMFISKAFFSVKSALLHSGNYSWYNFIHKFAYLQAYKSQKLYPNVEFANRCTNL